ncbi:hypothetical protein D3C83_233080 [compost metagenome]
MWVVRTSWPVLVATAAFCRPMANARSERNAKSRGPSIDPPNVPNNPKMPAAASAARMIETRTSGNA